MRTKMQRRTKGQAPACVLGGRSIMCKIGEGGTALRESKVCGWFAARQEEEQEMLPEVGKGLVTRSGFILNGPQRSLSRDI